MIRKGRVFQGCGSRSCHLWENRSKICQYFWWNEYVWTSLAVQWVRLCAPNAGGPGSIPGWGTRSHRPQLRVRMQQLKIPHAAMKIPCAATKTRSSQNK